MQTVPKLIACTPPKETSIKVKVNSGFATVEQKIELMPLTVVMDHKFYKTNDVVYLRGDSMKQIFCREVLSVGELKFILVPEEFIVAYEHKIPSMPVYQYDDESSPSSR